MIAKISNIAHQKALFGKTATVIGRRATAFTATVINFEKSPAAKNKGQLKNFIGGIAEITIAIMLKPRARFTGKTTKRFVTGETTDTKPKFFIVTGNVKITAVTEHNAVLIIAFKNLEVILNFLINRL